MTRPPTATSERRIVVHHHQVGRFRSLTGAHQEAASIQDEGTRAAQAILILGREAIPERLLGWAEPQLGPVAAFGLGQPEKEAEANQTYGIRPLPFQIAGRYETSILNSYFDILIRYGDQHETLNFQDLIEVEPQRDGNIDVRLRNLEYDLTRAIKKTIHGFRSTAELFERVEGTVRFTALISDDSLPEVFEDVPDAVRKAGEQLAEQGGGRFEFVELDPTAEDEVGRMAAERFGAGPMSLGFFGGEQFYLYGFLETGGQIEQLDLVSEGLSAASIREAVEDSADDSGWAYLGNVGQYVANRSPEFDSRNYGYAKLGNLVRAIGLFETDERASQTSPAKLIYIRDKRRKSGSR